MRWLAKTFTGLLLAATLLAVGGYFGVNYLMAQLTQLPPKPMFPNDNPDFLKKNTKKNDPKSMAKESEKSGKKPSEKVTDGEKEAAKPKPLPPGAFEGRVTYGEGLVLRESASKASTTLGGVEFNEKITVLETAADGEWQRVRTNNGKEGWIRGGYVEKN